MGTKQQSKVERVVLCGECKYHDRYQFRTNVCNHPNNITLRTDYLRVAKLRNYGCEVLNKDNDCIWFKKNPWWRRLLDD